MLTPIAQRREHDSPWWCWLEDVEKSTINLEDRAVNCMLGEGVWTYRSFRNLPHSVDDFNEIRFGQGELFLAGDSEPGKLRGQLAFRSNPIQPDDGRMTLHGSVQAGNPLTVRFQGVGVVDTSAAGWVYDYVGYLVPDWPDGKAQQTALVGSVIRSVPHNGQPAGYVGSFVAVLHNFLEPRLVIPLPPPVLAMLASKEHRLHHAVWHGTRNAWLTLSDEKKEQIRQLGWQPGGKEVRPAVAAGSPLVRNGSGEDFLFMHRQMILAVNSMAKMAGNEPIPAWSTLPAPGSLVVEPNFDNPNPVLPPPGNPDGYAVPSGWIDPNDEVTNRRIHRLKSDGHYWSRMRWWEREFKNPQYLSQLTLGELGSLLEFSVHNDMHMRWTSMPRDPRDGSTLVAGRLAEDIRDLWDNPLYDFLGEFYSSHVNPVFWRLHGWIDNRINDWFDAHEAVHPGEISRSNLDGVPWFAKGKWVHTDAPWAGSASPPDNAAVARSLVKPKAALRQTNKPHWF
ncbi:hypothetical protein BH10PLA2_BH10PLA2_11690 [soil metagenome]